MFTAFTSVVAREEKRSVRKSEFCIPAAGAADIVHTAVRAAADHSIPDFGLVGTTLLYFCLAK
jgi:hypothetical protein